MPLRRLTRPWLVLLFAACAPSAAEVAMTAEALQVPLPAAVALNDGALPGAQAPTAPSFDLTVDGPFVQGATTSVSVSGVPANNGVRVLYSLGGVQAGPCLPILSGSCLSIAGPVAFLPGVLPAGGPLTLPVPVPAGAPSAYLSLQAVALPSGAVSNVVAFDLAGATSGVSPTSDIDADGFSFAAGDCSDSDPSIFPGAADATGDGIDQDCDGTDGVDADGDGDGDGAFGGTDCNDADATVYAGAPELCNGIDNDCDGTLDSASGVSACLTPASDTFTVAVQAVDVLFVLDKSGSMNAYEPLMVGAVPSLIAPWVSAGTDVQVGAITVDMGSSSQSGRLQQALGQTIATNAAGAPVDLDTWLSSIFIAPLSPGGAEQPLAATQAALSAPLSTTDNAGFLRTDAHLAVVYLTDEDDQSTGLPALYALGLQVLKNAPGASVATFGLTQTTASACSSFPAGGTPRLDSFFGVLGSSVYDICTPSFDTPFAEIGQDVQALIEDHVFPLSDVPDPASVSVSRTGPFGLSIPLPAVDWSYDAGANEVTVVPSAVQPGDQLLITYGTP